MQVNQHGLSSNSPVLFAGKIFWLFLFLITAMVIAAACFYFIAIPKITRISPATNAQNVALDSEIKINFSGPINRNVLIPTIEPDIPGEWKYEGSFLRKHLFKTLVFYPQEDFQPKKKYVVKLQDVEGVLKLSRKSYQIDFTTQDLPKIISVSAKNNRQIRVQLSRPNPGLVDFEFEIAPEVSFSQQLSQNQDSYTLHLNQELLPQTNYDFRSFSFFAIKDKETKEVVYSKDLGLFESEINVKDDSEKLVDRGGTFNLPIDSAQAAAVSPKIISYSPQGINNKITSQVKITFSQPMDQSSVENNFYISPNVAGDFSWSEDARTVTFTPQENLSYGVLYRVIVAMYAKDIDGNRLSYSRYFRYYFQTYGKVKAKLYPRNGLKGVSVSSYFKVYFNQPVDPESAKAHFSYRPALAGTFFFNASNTRMFFIPKYPNSRHFRYGFTYRAHLSAGVKSIHGLDSVTSFSTSFTTQVRTRQLKVPLDFQDYPLSCEAAALRMALMYKGKRVGERSIMKRVGVDGRPRQGNRWADPYRIFVGSLFGQQNSSGYGVYWQPIARAARTWRPGSRATCGMSLSQLTTEVYKRNPVVVWGVYGNGYADSWSSWSGRRIPAWKGEHARTVIGFIGGNNPRKIILNDPYAGKLYWSRAKFLADWNKFGRCGVVVR